MDMTQNRGQKLQCSGGVQAERIKKYNLQRAKKSMMKLYLTF
jgi:hypothetical protein